MEAVLDVLHMLKDTYHVDIPIYITENGMAHDSGQPLPELMEDDDRIDYIREVLVWVHRAIEEGIDVRGYYLWSLMDNFEWAAGYCARFGIYYSDYETQEMKPKKSAKWYRDVIRHNGF